MRLLFLSLMLPVPANNGHKIRALSLLRALVADGHEVSLLTFKATDEPDGDSTLLRQLCHEVEIVPMILNRMSGRSDYLRRLRGLASPRSFSVERFASPLMAERIRFHLARSTFDAVVSDSIFSLVNLPPTQVPLVLNHPDVEHMILRRYLPLASNPAKLLYAWLEGIKVKAWEREACRRATLGMACSGQDRNLLQSLCPGLPLVIVPNVVDVESYVPDGDGDQLTVLYQGAMDWYPNRDAVEFFVSAILPELQKLIPDVKFVVAGRNPPERFRSRFARVRGIEFTGTVPDMRPVISRAMVCVVPLRIGSGTRLKILEAAAMQKPVVSTRIGAEGLDFVDGSEILIADKPELFARAVASLLQTPPLARAIGRAARKCVEANYSFSALRAAVSTALGAVLARGASSQLNTGPPKWTVTS